MIRQLLKRLGNNSESCSKNELSRNEFLLEDFRNREVFRQNYKTIANAIIDTIDFQTVLDLGSANGLFMDPLLESGRDVLGYELSCEVLPLLPDEIRKRTSFGDATKLGKIGNFDLVSCIEVAEHVPPDSSQGLVDTIVGNSTNWIYFTSASPYQPGHGHINCQQQFYWLNMFRKKSFYVEWDVTEQFLKKIQGITPAKWLEWNSLILKKH